MYFPVLNAPFVAANRAKLNNMNKAVDSSALEEQTWLFYPTSAKVNQV